MPAESASMEFTNDEMNSLVKSVIETVIRQEPYKHSDVNAWENTIMEQIVQRLVKQNPTGWKYIVSTAIIQKNGAGMCFGSNCYWNSSADQCFQVRWENKHVHCIVNIYVVAV